MSTLNSVVKRPTVSVGLFVYNGDNSLREAIDSILSQSFTDFELIISDNASTDNTELICREYAKQDKRICYVRQPVNIGPTENCLFVLDEAKGEYFMWAAHDDVRSTNFIECNLDFLQKNSDFIASTSQVRFKGGLADSIRMGDKSLDQKTAEERFLAALQTWTGCGRFYSLMRRSAIVESQIIRRATYIGADIAFILELVIKGKFNRLEEGCIELGRDGLSGSGNIYRAYRVSVINWLLPLHKFSTEIWKLSLSFSYKSRITIASTIFKMNLITFLHQIKTELKQRFL